jgi:hypothetical protein
LIIISKVFSDCRKNLVVTGANNLYYTAGQGAISMEQMDKQKYGFLPRLHRAFGPIAGGLVLDLVDLATFGPIGLLGGWILGAGVGWWIGSIYGFSKEAKLTLAISAGIYCMIPFTEPLPIATIVSAIARFFEKPPRQPPSEEDEEGSPPRKWIDSEIKE